ncbi:thioredoxin family protein [Anoxynatronum buryatiense]|uniref:Thioredoxin n=1 Tax=Anoxynatronum buryatiense TaxID=489973 RepID=A0AA46AHW6_9CLOT|nr:thioredoxin family protein [Anoxynatronum buryatiense]SMP44179.1 Thioredoxin [Anoxynatronum buryatiense]
MSLTEIHTMESLETVLQTEKRVLLYIGDADCAVCRSTKPRIQTMMKSYPLWAGVEASAQKTPDIAGQYLVFSIPAVLMFVEGKEIFRSARFLDFQQIQQVFQRQMMQEE